MQDDAHLPEEGGHAALANDEDLDAPSLGLGEDGLRLGFPALGSWLDALPVHTARGVPRFARGAHRLHEIHRLRAAGARPTP